MKENKSIIKKQDDNSKIYCHEEYAQDLYNLMMNENPRPKDIRNGEIFRVLNFKLKENDEVEVTCENLVPLYFNISKEKKYLELVGFDEKEFREWILSGSQHEYLMEKKVFIMVENADHRRGSMYSAHLTTIITEFKEQKYKPTSAYVAKILSKNQGGFIVEIQGIKAFLPGSLAAANKINNFESYIGKEIYVMIEDYLENSGIFVVSYKKYLENILPSKLAALEKNQKMVGNITGTSKFGIFVEFDEIFTGLLHTAEMADDTYEKFSNRLYKVGESIEVWLKDIVENRLVLTQVDPKIKQDEMELFRQNTEGNIKLSTVVYIKPHGALMEIEKGVLGLLPIKEMKRMNKRFSVGDSFEVLIKKVDTITNRIYLSLTDECESIIK